MMYKKIQLFNEIPKAWENYVYIWGSTSLNCFIFFFYFILFLFSFSFFIFCFLSFQVLILFNFLKIFKWNKVNQSTITAP